MQIAAIEQMKGLPARRQPEAADEKSLRAELAAAIETRKLADAKAAKIKSGLEKCAAMLSAAESEVSVLEAKIAKAERRASERDAAGIVAAIKAGAPVPMTAMPEISTAELDCAKVKAATIRAAHAQFQNEWHEANAAVSAASGAVAIAADLILEFAARGIAAELIAVCELYWNLTERFDAFVMLDERRQGGPKLDGFRREVRHKTDRRARAIAGCREFMETPKWQEHLVGLMAAQERRWQEFRLALMRDAGAQFEASPCQ